MGAEHAPANGAWKSESLSPDTGKQPLGLSCSVSLRGLRNATAGRVFKRAAAARRGRGARRAHHRDPAPGRDSGVSVARAPRERQQRARGGRRTQSGSRSARGSRTPSCPPRWPPRLPQRPTRGQAAAGCCRGPPRLHPAGPRSSAARSAAARRPGAAHRPEQPPWRAPCVGELARSSTRPKAVARAWPGSSKFRHGLCPKLLPVSALSPKR